MSKNEQPQPPVKNEITERNKYSKREWIEHAEVLKVEPYVMAGALFEGKEEEMYSKEEVEQKLDAFWHRPLQGGMGDDYPTK